MGVDHDGPPAISVKNYIEAHALAATEHVEWTSVIAETPLSALRAHLVQVGEALVLARLERAVAVQKLRHPEEGLDKGGWRGSHVVNGRNRMTIDPCIPPYTTPGRSTSSFDPPGRHSLHQARSTVGCSAFPQLLDYS